MQQRGQRVGTNLMWIQLFVAVTSAVVMLAKITEVAGCENRCDYPSLEFATRSYWISDLVILLITASLYFLTRHSLRHAWVVPALGLSVTSVIFATTMIIVGNALIVG